MSEKIICEARGWERYSIDKHSRLPKPCVNREILRKNKRERNFSRVDGEKLEPSAQLYPQFSCIIQRMVFVQGGKGGGHNYFTAMKLELGCV